MSAQQLDLTEAFAAAEEGMRRSTEPLSDATRRAFRRVLDECIATGKPFSLDDMRARLDLAQVPAKARGGLMSQARNAGVVEQVGYVRSTHRPTHGKAIATYRGTL